MKSKVLLLDVSSLAYRAYYALPFMSAPNGQPTNAVYGFVNMFWRLIGDLDPDYGFACLDSKEPTFREEVYTEYKANRVAMPDEFYSQLPLIEEFLSLCDASIIRLPGYEADDLIGSVISFFRRERKDLEFYIVSSDKDLLQLVSDGVYFCEYKNKKLEVLDEARVIEKMGVRPAQIPDYLALLGDSSDNIPGVPGIGKKTAVKLLREYGSVDGMYANLDSLPERLRRALEESRDLVYRNLELVKVKTDLPISLELVPLKKSPDDGLYRFYQKLGFKSLLKRQFPERIDGESGIF